MFAALVLKAAVHQVDSRDRGRHLQDAVALLACVEDPFFDRATFVGGQIVSGWATWGEPWMTRGTRFGWRCRLVRVNQRADLELRTAQP